MEKVMLGKWEVSSMFWEVSGMFWEVSGRSVESPWIVSRKSESP